MPEILRQTSLLILLLLGACSMQQSTVRETEQNLELDKVQAAAREAYQRSDWVESEKHYAIITRRVPAELEPWFRLGNIYARTRRPELAVAAYREVLVRDPQHARAWHNMGVIQIEQANNTFLQMSQHIDPTNPLYAQSMRLGGDIARLLRQGSLPPAIPPSANDQTKQP